MSLKSGQNLTVTFTLQDATGAAADADSPPSGTLMVNGVADDATVTVTSISTGLYRASVTLPTLNAGDVVAMLIEASVDAVPIKEIVFQAVADTQHTSDVKAVVDAIKAVTDLLPNGGALTDLALLDGKLNTIQGFVKTVRGLLAGTVRDKAGSPGVAEVLNPEDEETPIAEVTFSETTPYRKVTLL